MIQKLYRKYLTWLMIVAVFSAGMGLVSCDEEEGRLHESEVTAEFNADKVQVLEGETVSFEDQSTGDVVHWSWVFPGGSPNKSNEQNPVVTYNSAGSYEVTLIVSNARYTNSVAKSAFIDVASAPQPITADFSADKVSILSGETISFQDQSTGGPTTWAWEVIPETGNTITSSEKDPEITFPDPGIYSVRLVASNSAYSDEELKTNYITVVDATSVAADFSADKRFTYSGQEITFTDLSVGNVAEREWIFEGGSPATSSEQNPTILYASPGKYKVSLVASNDSKSSTKEEVGYITIVPGDGLLAFLPFSSNSSDAGPFGLNVDNGDGGVAFTGTDRNLNTSATAVFDGTGSLTIPAVEAKQLGMSSYSIGIWLKSNLQSRMMIWQEGGGGAGNPTTWFRINDNATNQLYRFNINTSTVMNIGTGDGASVLSDDQWHYVVCTRDAEAGIGQVYVDGQLVKTRDAFTVSDISNDLGFRIGGQNSGPNEVSSLFTGELDDLVIYNRVLSGDEISLLSGF